MVSKYEDTSDGYAWLQALQKNQLRYPDVFVVRWLARIRSLLPEEASGFDMGFGSGQHLRLFMDYGIKTYGSELLEHAIDIGHEILQEHPLAGEIFKGDIEDINLVHGSFDVFLSWGCIFLKPYDEIIKMLLNIEKALKPGGYALFNFRTKDNWFYGLGDELQSGHWLLDRRAGPYSGGKYTFLDEKEVRSLFADTSLEIENFERTDWWSKNMTERHSWWIVQCCRK
jgi:SAM-dependent methyltransferase